jgi:hypothetical protein
MWIMNIWISKNKNKSHFLDKGERLVMQLDKEIGKKQNRLTLTRQFYNYPEWEDVESCRFSVNKGVIRRLKETLDKIEGSL